VGEAEESEMGDSAPTKGPPSVEVFIVRRQAEATLLRAVQEHGAEDFGCGAGKRGERQA
jgi:hypothetical protein